jgi:hypothetical protein
LEQFKKEYDAKNFASIEDSTLPADCFAAGAVSPDCAQLTDLQGRACFILARQEAAANAACPPATDTARRRLQCAARDFGVATRGASMSANDVNDMTEMRARALYCGATLVDRAAGLPDVREAFRELGTLSSTPERDQLAATTQLYVANSDQLSGAERCAAAKAAAQIAARALQNNPSGNILEGLNDTRAHAVSVGNHLTGCRVP